MNLISLIRLAGEGIWAASCEPPEFGYTELTLAFLCLETPTIRTANSASNFGTIIERLRGFSVPTSPSGSWRDTKKCTNNEFEPGRPQQLRTHRLRKNPSRFLCNLSLSASTLLKMRSGNLHMVSTLLITSALGTCLVLFASALDVSH